MPVPGPSVVRRGEFTLGPVTLHDLRFAGEEATTKLAQLRPEIGRLKADALVISDPHAVAWTFNIRGSDVAHTPLPLAFAVVPREGRPAGHDTPDPRWPGNGTVCQALSLGARAHQLMGGPTA